MSKPRITAFSEHEWVERRVMCKPDPVNSPVGVVVEVEFFKGDHDAALAALEACVEDVKAQIAESHAPTWDGPRKVGEERMPPCLVCMHRRSEHDIDGVCEHYPCQCEFYEASR